jgi:GNAT superfamily N-acetyltransferase
MNKNSLIIRQASKDDIRVLADLMSELGYDTTPEEMSERLDNIILQSHYYTLVACYNDTVTGMVGASHHYFYERNGIYVRIVAFVTLSAYRKIGIGQALLAAIEHWAKEIGANSILLNCGNREARKTAHEFYSKRGYEARSTGYMKKI